LSENGTVTERLRVGDGEEPSIEQLRGQLTARLGRCFERLDDAVSELIALHSVRPDQIRASVEFIIAEEEREAGISPDS
jgi:hypothetical protein